ncbi:MAG: ThuA domain-containing protein [Verrucomicrobia bacterium]|nr:ThuA domain-containing protein [Verrucomicrobiota bacterium]
MKAIRLFAAGLLATAFVLNTHAQEAKPLRALLITGGCCHDYANQKDILKKGIEARANVVVDQLHTADSSTKPPLAILGNPDYAKGYDVVIHDECAADLSDPSVIKGVLAPHRAGVPGVNLHCAMHSYRVGNPGERAEAGSERAAWFDYLGLQSSSHGPQQPIAIRFTDKNHPITQGFADWTTINEELYNNIQVLPTATPLASGKQTVKRRDGTTRENETVVAWVNDFEGTRVFSTTIGHNNATVEDARYLDLVTRGLLWACGKLDEKGNIKPGYGQKN